MTDFTALGLTVAFIVIGFAIGMLLTAMFGHR